jgi:beta-galactosidase
LIQKHGMLAYPRIGPWTHGEVRNGGSPDWIVDKKIMEDRSNHPVYQYYAERYLTQMSKQMEGLFYKEGGPIVGVQIENEYWFGEKGESHIKWIKQTAQKLGIDVPLYTVTGWGDVSVPQNEVIPLFGTYPDAPWNADIKVSDNEADFSLSNYRKNQMPEKDVKKSKKYKVNFLLYPYFTCEMGIGIQNTYHRRHIINAIDGYGLVISKLGSGSNLVGYYMFAGATNPQAVNSTLEEEEDISAYYTTVPSKSYDFQAAIRESGEINPAYRQIKKLHYFLNEYGGLLAPMETYVGDQNKDDLEYGVRVKDNSGFVFVINYERNNPKDDKVPDRFSVKLKSETITFPSKGVKFIDSTICIWPINMKLDQLTLKYATAQPLCNIDNTFFFCQSNGINPEFCFDASSINSVNSTSGSVTQDKGRFIISDVIPTVNNIIKVSTKTGQIYQVIVLSKEESKNVWLFRDGEKKELYLSDAGLVMNQGKLEISSTNNSISFMKFGKESRIYHGESLKETPNGLFTEYKLEVPKKTIVAELTPKSILQDAEWLSTNEKDTLKAAEVLMKRYFIKEFSLTDPAKIKSALMYLAPEVECRIQINDIWINQPVVAGKLNVLDFGGYLHKGENKLVMEFPLCKGKKAFAARLIVEHFNANKVNITTNTSWMGRDDYMRPSPFTPSHYAKFGTLEKMKTVSVPKTFETLEYNGFKEWTVKVPENYLDGINAAFMHVSYVGNSAQLYEGHRLLEDNFNNFDVWPMGLHRLDLPVGGKELNLSIKPIPSNYKIIFDRVPKHEDLEKASVKELKIIPEYKVIIE